MNQAKEFFQYIFNSVKMWVIVQPWESGIRVRCGKKVKKLKGGVYFRIPYLDNVFVQEMRLRVVDAPVQTCMTSDLKTITLKSAIGYTIKDVYKLYNTLYHPETSILNIAMAEIAQSVFIQECANITPQDIEKKVLEKLKEQDYGIDFDYFKITSYAAVRTYRLIQDTTYSWEGLKMDEKK